MLSGYLVKAESVAVALVIHQKDYLLLLPHRKVQHKLAIYRQDFLGLFYVDYTLNKTQLKEISIDSVDISSPECSIAESGLHQNLQ